MWYKHIIHVQVMGFPKGRIYEYWMVNNSPECDTDDYRFVIEKVWDIVLIKSYRTRRPSHSNSNSKCKFDIPKFIKFVEVEDELLEKNEELIQVLHERCDTLTDTIQILKKMCDI